jgi:hypothetical protein
VDVKHGYGEEEGPDFTYKGHYLLGKRYGGVVVHPHCKIVTFEFRNGEGHLVFTSGDEYKGHFQNGVYGGGEGELICGDYHYVGEWKEGKRCGKGRCVLSNCDL